MTPRTWPALALLLLLNGQSLAESPDELCATRATVTEHAACQTPPSPGLVTQVDAALRAAQAAHPSKAEAFQGDQARWLDEERIAARLPALTSPTDGKVESTPTTRYEARLRLLSTLDDTSGPTPLNVIRKAALSLKPSSDDLMTALVAQGAPIVLATERPKDDRFRFQPDRAMAQMLAIVDPDADRDLPGSNVGSAFKRDSRSSSWVEAPYRIEGSRALSVPVPDAWDHGSDDQHYLAPVGDTVAAISVTRSLEGRIVLSLNPWDDHGFGPTQSLTLTFDAALAVAGAKVIGRGVYLYSEVGAPQ